MFCVFIVLPSLPPFWLDFEILSICLLFCFVIFWMLCYVWNKKKMLITKKITPGLLLLYVLGHRPFELSAVQSSLLLLTESGQTVHLFTLQNWSGCFCLLSRHQWTPVTQCHWKPCSSCITLLHHVSQMMLYALDHELFQAFSILFFFPSFWNRLILISAIQRMLLQKWSCFFVCCFFIWAKSNLALFVPCGESSICSHEVFSWL